MKCHHWTETPPLRGDGDNRRCEKQIWSREIQVVPPALIWSHHTPWSQMTARSLLMYCIKSPPAALLPTPSADLSVRTPDEQQEFSLRKKVLLRKNIYYSGYKLLCDLKIAVGMSACWTSKRSHLIANKCVYNATWSCWWRVGILQGLLIRLYQMIDEELFTSVQGVWDYCIFK